ncbi:hypothetical protein OESDEN_23711 [Oesophagostomum dentatum]|uniref:Uncharacterized protein n=1 Tax=Oesophagostomum dentatum TaxID=61180 RepID=A0A0B1RVH1_OESDE|nr:hypothetical protein OESDEN_23711 [Oesophagostomum dentatum]
MTSIYTRPRPLLFFPRPINSHFVDQGSQSLLTPLLQLTCPTIQISIPLVIQLTRPMDNMSLHQPMFMLRLHRLSVNHR